MQKFQWNSLRIGDDVLLHDASPNDRSLARGVVVAVDGHTRINGVGIGVVVGTSRQILWPSYLAVHLDPLDPTESCWRCQAVSDAALERGSPEAAPQARRIA